MIRSSTIPGLGYLPARALARQAFWLPGLVLVIVTMMMAHGRTGAQTKNLKLDRFTTEQGLSDNYVMTMLYDRRGFMWFGTRDGLNRYDGLSFRTFRNDPNNPHSISDGSSKCLFQDREGTLWIGTHGGGLNRYDPVHENFTSYQHDPHDSTTLGAGGIVGITEDAAGRLWVATDGPNSGITILDKKSGRCEHLRHDPADPYSLSSDHVTSVCTDSAGTIWVLTFDKGLNRFDPASCGFVNHRTMPAYFTAFGGYGYRLYATHKDEVWARINRQMVTLNIHTGHISQYTTLLGADTVAPKFVADVAYADREGRLWVGTLFSGLEITDSARGTSYQLRYDPANPYSLISNRVFCVTSDGTGNTWIGTDAGINKLNRRNWQFQYYQHNPADSASLSAGVVRSLLIDSGGVMWAATADQGLDRLDMATGKAIHYRPTGKPGSISSEFTNTVYRDRRGTLWIGTNYGLNRFDDATGTFTVYSHNELDTTTIGIAGVWSMLEDSYGNFWVGTLGGGFNLFDRSTGRATHYYNIPGDSTSLSHNFVLTIFEDSHRNIWVGTDDGLDKFNRTTGRFQRYHYDPRDPGSLSNNRVWYIHEDRKGMLWLATSGGGVDMLNPATGRCRRFTEQTGMASNTACSIVEDSRGRMWVGTSNGLTRLDPATGECRNYTAADGLLVSEFHFKSCAQQSNGMMFFGAAKGIIMLHPDSIQENRVPPKLSLISFKTIDTTYRLDTSITMKQCVELEHDNNFFTIEFASFDFTNPRRNQFRYLLEAFDADWRTTNGNRPYADYTNVPPGTYQFRVIGANNDGVWNEQGLTLMIDIRPAFWQTWWFRLLMILTAAGLLISVVLYRIRDVRRKARQERDLVGYQLQALRAQMNPHFIFNSLNSVLHFIVGHDMTSAHRYLSKFSRLMRSTLESSKNEFVPLASELDALRLYLELESLRFDKSFEYTITVAPDVDVDAIEIPPMIIQPYAENAIKHGLAHRRSAGSLGIDLRRDGPYLICTILDNGIGRKRAAAIRRDQLTEHRSYGMEVTKNRLDVLSSIHGQPFGLAVFDLEDEHGNGCGTRIEIRIPID